MVETPDVERLLKICIQKWADATSSYTLRLLGIRNRSNHAFLLMIFLVIMSCYSCFRGHQEQAIHDVNNHIDGPYIGIYHDNYAECQEENPSTLISYNTERS